MLHKAPRKIQLMKIHWSKFPNSFNKSHRTLQTVQGPTLAMLACLHLLFIAVMKQLTKTN